VQLQPFSYPAILRSFCHILIFIRTNAKPTLSRCRVQNKYLPYFVAFSPVRTMRRIVIGVFLLLLSSTSHLYARLAGQTRADSLIKELSLQKDDTNKVNLLDELAWEYAPTVPDTGLLYAQQALALATKLAWNNGIANANSAIGKNYAVLSAYDQAQVFVLRALKLYEHMGDKKGMAKTTNQMGNIHSNQGDWNTALAYFFTAQKLYGQTGNRKGVAVVMNNIGYIYVGQSNYSRAMEYAFKSLAIHEEIKYTPGVISALNNVGDIYTRQREFAKALDYFSKGLKLAEELGSKDLIASGLHALGNTYSYQKDHTRALDYSLRALKMEEEMGRKRSVASTSGDIGIIYTDMKNYTMAAAYQQKALKISEEIGDKQGIATISSNIGILYFEILRDTTLKQRNVTNLTEQTVSKYQPTGDIPVGKPALMRAAIGYLRQSNTACRPLQAIDIMQVNYEGLAELCKISGDYKNAIVYADSARELEDSIFSRQNRERMANYENEREEYRDSLRVAAAQKEADAKAAHRRNYELIGGAVLLVLSGFTFLLKKNNKLLSREKKENETLLHNILPEAVAAELKATGATTAKHYDNVTVLFTDFVNFTRAGVNMSPQNLIDELHTCFKKFDEITAKYNIEKIKTIGDAYLAVAGLPATDPHHAEHIVLAAKEITAFMDDRVAKMGTERTFRVRVGVHSGSVVAGIVGVRKFAYDIWGDTVNTAARMEQSGEAGKINISQATYDLVKDKFTCEYRGEVEAKGKGSMKMYFVQ
jgi:class 3 adenylate cyclase